MIAEFYIISESFVNNVLFTSTEIENRIISLAEDFNYIRKYHETNKILVHNEIVNVYFLDGVLLSDLLYNDAIANQHIDRDIRLYLKKIIIESEWTSISNEEVINVLLNEHSEDICHGLIAFNQVPNVNPEVQIIYNRRGWLEFRRYFLGIYPRNKDFYLDECIKYFPNLYFHERIRDTINAILAECPKKIIFHLSALNDIFKNIDIRGKNRTQVLEEFSIIAHLDETASLEGNAKKKAVLTFNFINDKNIAERVCCEPHLKLCYSDLNNSYSNYRRIYFHEGKENIKNGKILIGHIGRHI